MDKTDTEKNQDQEENTTERNLGDLLKSYRESADMDIKQAASSLCLTAGTLQDLENENFEDLPEAPYIRGYLRGYAKLANVSSSEVIALYENVRGGKSESIEHYRSRSQAVNDVIKPAIPPYVFQMGGVVLLLLLLIVLSMIPSVKNWAGGIWSDFSQDNVVATEEEGGETSSESETATNATQDNLQASAAATAPTTPSVVEQNEDKSEAVAMDGMIDRKNGNATSAGETKTDAAVNNALPDQPASTTDQAQAANASTTEAENAEQTTDASTTTTSDDASSTTASTEASDTATPSTSATTSGASTATSTSESATADSAAPTATTSAESTDTPEENTPAATTEVDLSGVDTASGEAVVKLVFKDEVWMRVNGVKNKKLFGGLKKSGDTHEFKASKPLSFKVGNAPGVDIYINGKLYDQTPHLRGVVSKFKVEAAAQ